MISFINFILLITVKTIRKLVKIEPSYHQSSQSSFLRHGVYTGLRICMFLITFG